MKLLTVESCASTQDLAREHLEDCDAVLSLHQTAGRGRAGREWLCAEGALAVSFVLKTSLDLKALTLLPLAAGVAVAHTVLELGSAIELKWPNDLVRYRDRSAPSLGFSKLGGILCEAHGMPPKLAVVVGLGLNLAGAPSMENAAGLGLSISPAAFVERLWPHLVSTSERVGRDPGSILQDWLALAPPLGTPMTRGDLSGRFAGLAPSGALLLQTSSGLREISAGDVAFL